MTTPTTPRIDTALITSAFRTNPDPVTIGYREAETFTSMLERLMRWTVFNLIPYLSTNFEDIQESWVENVTNFVDIINAGLAAQSADINQALTDQQQQVAANLATTLNQIVSGESAALNDAAVNGALLVANSQALALLDGRYLKPATADANYSKRPITYLDLPTSGLWSSHHTGGGVPYSTMPVNTISSMRAAIGLGASILDLDVRATKDGVIVVHHDSDTSIIAPSITPALTIENEEYFQLPQIDMRPRVGTGWTPENIPTLRQVFAEFGGKVMITIELKSGGLTLLPAVAALIKQYRLEKSTYINFNVSGINATADVTAAGLLTHLYGCASVADVQNAIAAGAKLIEIDAAASTDIIAAATAIVSANGGRFIAGPINSRTVRQQLDPRFNGYVSDSPGYLMRDYGTPLTLSIAGALRSGKQGVGWIARNPYNLTDSINWLTASGLVVFDGVANRVQLRDLSGDHGTVYSFTFKVKFTTLPTTTTTYVGIRGCCPVEVPGSDVSSDPAHKGYVFALRANGQLAIFKVDPTAGTSSSIGSTTGAAALVAGTTYSVRVDVTGTSITATRLDTNTTTGPINDTTYRGGHFHVTTSMTDGKAALTALDFTA